jgi:hypothetical protein
MDKQTDRLTYKHYTIIWPKLPSGIYMLYISCMGRKLRYCRIWLQENKKINYIARIWNVKKINLSHFYLINHFCQSAISKSTDTAWSNYYYFILISLCFYYSNMFGSETLGQKLKTLKMARNRACGREKFLTCIDRTLNFTFSDTNILRFKYLDK